MALTSPEPSEPFHGSCTFRAGCWPRCLPHPQGPHQNGNPAGREAPLCVPICSLGFKPIPIPKHGQGGCCAWREQSEGPHCLSLLAGSGPSDMAAGPSEPGPALLLPLFKKEPPII